MTHIPSGSEWLVDAEGCRPEALRSADQLSALFERVIKELVLKPLAPAVFHAFPAPGGVTGFVLLAESHLAIHTFPEIGFAAIDLYCCRERAEWDWSGALGESLGARVVSVRRVDRGRR